MTDKPDIEALSREFCELTGKEWHELEVSNEPLLRCVCGFATKFPSVLFDHCYKSNTNPDFSDAREVLKVMRARCKNDYEFSSFLFSLKCPGTYAICLKSFIDLIEDDTGLMLKEAVEWLRKEKR